MLENFTILVIIVTILFDIQLGKVFRAPVALYEERDRETQGEIVPFGVIVIKIGIYMML